MGNQTAAAARRAAAYREFRDTGMTRVEAAARIGVGVKAAGRYDQAIAYPTLAERAAGRREDYAELRDVHGCSIRKAAARMGISVRTALRYEAARRELAGASR